MLNIVIPMAGAGRRFADAGYRLPKPLILVHGTPMVKVVIDNLRPSQAHRFIFIAQRAHDAAYDLCRNLARWAPRSEVVLVDGMTEGAACTVLKARQLIDNQDALMIANSDQYVDADIDAYLAVMASDELDGLIMTMQADDPKWSYVGFDAGGHVDRVVEKQVISSKATVGIYNFRHGADFVAAAESMIAAGQRVNGEFYVEPVSKALIARGKLIGTASVGAVGDGMHGLGTPQDLDAFLSLALSRHAAGDGT